jgi:DAK2 domain fusion protein YloV
MRQTGTVQIRSVIAGASAALDAARERINDMNVYPVPDGDTGTNLSLSVRAIAGAVEEDEHHATAEGLAAAVKRAALLGARGNSGIILSQIVRGMCESVTPASRLDPRAVAQALRGAADAAYRAVREPVEGTILTVVREMAEEAEQHLADLPGQLDRILARGEAALARTPGMLAQLRDAGVVDAGGAGLVELVRGAIAGLRGETLAAHTLSGPALRLAEVHAEPSRFRYCTNYLVSGIAVDPEVLEASLRDLGDCLIVVGDSDATKVHVHTDDPGRALSLATAMGGLSGVDIADMHAQIVGRAERLAEPAREPEEPRDTDVVFIVAGAGNAAIARSLGARRIVEGGQSMNPATSEILAAIESASASSVVVLPNNRNVLLAARAAVESAARPAALVETTSIPAGLAALVVYDGRSDLAASVQAMERAIAHVVTGEVTRAVRTARVDEVDVAVGDWLALVGGRVVSARPTLPDALGDAIARLVADGKELVTVLTGAEEPDAAAVRDTIEALAKVHRAVDFDVREGGQPHYAALLSAE